jgi:hypothetical protein
MNVVYFQISNMELNQKWKDFCITHVRGKVKLSLYLTKHYTVNMYGGSCMDPHFPDLVGGEWSASCPGYFTPGERAPIQIV